MQLAVADSYQTMIEILAGLVKAHLSKPAKLFTRAKVDDQTFLLVTAVLEQEDEEHDNVELAIEWLARRKAKKIA